MSNWQSQEVRSERCVGVDKKQFDELIRELERIQNLLILIATKSGAKSEEIGKVMGVGASAVRKLLAGIGIRKKGRR